LHIVKPAVMRQMMKKAECVPEKCCDDKECCGELGLEKVATPDVRTIEELMPVLRLLCKGICKDPYI